METNLHPTMTQVKDIVGWDICGGSSVYDPDDAAREILGKPERDVRGDQVMYLFRRFGYPIHGWDDYKSITGYFLTTPDPDIILWCKPYSSPDLSFGFGISADLAQDAYRAAMTARGARWKSHSIYQRIDRAIRAAIHELLRPVYIRGVDYDILGRPRNDSPAINWERAEYSSQAGYGLGEFDPSVGCMEARLLKELETAIAWIEQLQSYDNPDPSAPSKDELLAQLRAALS